MGFLILVVMGIAGIYGVINQNPGLAWCGFLALMCPMVVAPDMEMMMWPFKKKTATKAHETIKTQEKTVDAKPTATYEAWKADYEKMIAEEISIDEYLERCWNRRGPDGKTMVPDKPIDKPAIRNRMREMIQEARSKAGI